MGEVRIFSEGLVWVGIHYANELATVHLLVGDDLIAVANLLISLKRPARGERAARNAESDVKPRTPQSSEHRPVNLPKSESAGKIICGSSLF